MHPKCVVSHHFSFEGEFAEYGTHSVVEVCTIAWLQQNTDTARKSVALE